MTKFGAFTKSVHGRDYSYVRNVHVYNCSIVQVHINLLYCTMKCYEKKTTNNWRYNSFDGLDMVGQPSRNVMYNVLCQMMRAPCMLLISFIDLYTLHMYCIHNLGKKAPKKTLL